MINLQIQLHLRIQIRKVALTDGYEDAIVVSAITADNFELKHGLLTPVRNKQFYGHDKEDLYADILYFNKITSTLKFPDVPNTSIKLMLFPKAVKIANGICMLKHLKYLNLFDCALLEKLPEDLGRLECLEQLDITYTRISHLPQSILRLKRLSIATSSELLQR
uniref:30S ribosomal protein S10, chloroplastic n=1 Tax=Tanacetum cinerariifolium TaxID=118510 RepID=A0A699GUQ2_TANCI|nr:30S ribosomal protein S10, chloroplastic [Tanacetum cinerariifolium]